jgi:hypothetical protein
MCWWLDKAFTLQKESKLVVYSIESFIKKADVGQKKR